MTEDLIRALQIQAAACQSLGSPFTASLLNAAAADVAAGGPTAALLATWSGVDARQLMIDALPLRFAASLHDLVLSGEAPELSAAYAGQLVALDVDAAWSAAKAVIASHRPRLIDFMGHEPQTNEVRRSVCLVGGFLTVAAETGLPLRCFEIAASAGLNTSWDRYFYRLGDVAWGDPASPVRMDADWTGPRPPVEARVEVIERQACDRRPTDLADLAQRRRLLSYIWPDQLERLARAKAAIGVTLANGVKVETADAVDWTARVVAPQPGAATVLFHSVFWQYMPADNQAALKTLIEAKGATATADAPFAWLRMEPPANDLTGMEVSLTLWPGGETRILARVHPHGAAVTWTG